MHKFKVKYEPLQVRNILIEMKNLSELMVYSAYCSVIYGDVKLAKEVMRLEERVDYLNLQLVMHASLATRTAEDAESMLSVFRMASAIDKISDAAADIASVVVTSKPLLLVGRMLTKSEELISRVKVREGSPLANHTLEEVYDLLGYIFDVFAIRRGERWILEPDLGFRLGVDDVLLVRGSLEAITSLRRQALDMLKEAQPAELPSKYERIVKGLRELRDVSDLMVDLACSALITNSRRIAERIVSLENYVDELYINYEREVISTKELSLDDMLKLIRIAVATENIADAANEMAEIILRDIRPHPVLSMVMRESNERLLDIDVTESLDGKTIEDLGLKKLGASVLAVKRGEKWIIRPSQRMMLLRGDTLLIRCYSEAEDAILAMFQVRNKNGKMA